MGFEYQLSDWRVYSAEQAVGHDEPLDAGGAQSLVDQAVSSSWWSEWFPHAVPIEISIGGRETTEISGIKHFWSWSTPDAYPRATKYFIELHPRMLTARVVLHELAHCVSPSLIVEEIKDRVGRPAGMLRRKHLTHGSCFTAALSIITDNMLPGDDGQLAEAYRHFEVPIASHAELREQLLGQPAAIQERQAFIDDIRRESEQLETRYESEHAQLRATWIPTFPWGWYLLDYRRTFHRRAGGQLLSQKKLADEISRITPCTAKHISAIEHSRERPTDVAQLKRAMLMSIYLVLDPIWTRHNLQLTRWDCGGITLEEARIMNKQWADTVSKMNKQLREMPPRWKVEGHR